MKPESSEGVKEEKKGGETWGGVTYILAWQAVVWRALWTATIVSCTISTHTSNSS